MYRERIIGERCKAEKKAMRLARLEQIAAKKRLEKAAPGLLRACKGVASDMGHFKEAGLIPLQCNIDSWRDRLLDAIAAAEGK